MRHSHCTRDEARRRILVRARAPFAAVVGALILVLAPPAVAKVGIAEARISGPGLGQRDLRISAPATEGMWDSGIDVAGGVDDARAHSVGELGLTTADLGPKYVVTYRLNAGAKAPESVRQDLYPYATGGPVTYVPSGQHVAEGRPWGGAITAGWYQSSPEFFSCLVEQGLPESNPEVVTGSESAVDTASATRPTPWSWTVLTLIGHVAMSLVATRRRRVLGVPRR
jgi:hypothetical protein